LVAALIVGLLAPWVIPLLFGSDFAGAVAPLLILLPGQVFMNLGNVQAARLEADGRPGAASWAFFTGAVVTVVGVLIAVPIFGIEGAAFVTSVSQAIFFIVSTLARRAGGESIERPAAGDSPAPAEAPGPDDEDRAMQKGG
jgi:O-antigen/teichoic acid export membrane protein